MNLLDSLFGTEVPLVAKMLVAFGVIFGLLALFWFIGRRFLPGPRVGSSTRSRQPRLGVLDAHAVDARRKLVLIRRDNVEHLIMIGGPNDVVIESTILRGRPQSRPAPAPGERPIPPPERELPPPIERPAGIAAASDRQPAPERAELRSPTFAAPIDDEHEPPPRPVRREDARAETARAETPRADNVRADDLRAVDRAKPQATDLDAPPVDRTSRPAATERRDPYQAPQRVVPPQSAPAHSPAPAPVPSPAPSPAPVPSPASAPVVVPAAAASPPPVVPPAPTPVPQAAEPAVPSARERVERLAAERRPAPAAPRPQPAPAPRPTPRPEQDTSLAQRLGEALSRPPASASPAPTRAAPAPQPIPPPQVPPPQAAPAQAAPAQAAPRREPEPAPPSPAVAAAAASVSTSSLTLRLPDQPGPEQRPVVDTDELEASLFAEDDDAGTAFSGPAPAPVEPERAADADEPAAAEAPIGNRGFEHVAGYERDASEGNSGFDQSPGFAPSRAAVEPGFTPLVMPRAASLPPESRIEPRFEPAPPRPQDAAPGDGEAGGQRETAGAGDYDMAPDRSREPDLPPAASRAEPVPGVPDRRTADEGDEDDALFEPQPGAAPVTPARTFGPVPTFAPQVPPAQPAAARTPPAPAPKPEAPAGPPDPFASLEEEMASLLGRIPGSPKS